MKTYYLVYKLTNLVNGKIYIGCHMTKNLDDGYMGSGRRIGYAKQKYGIESFKKEILSFHETPEEMLAEEAKLVNEEFIGRDDVYNLMCGGRGSWFYVNLAGLNNAKSCEVLSRVGKLGGQGFSNKLKINKHFANEISLDRSKRMLNGKSPFNDNTEMTRRAALPEAIGKRKATFKERSHQQGEKNSSFGTIWISNGIESKKIKKNDSIPDGWRRGRKIL